MAIIGHTWNVDEVTRPEGMTAAKFNAYIRDDLRALQTQVDGLTATSILTPTAWTPAVDQAGAITVTVNEALYVLVDKLCVFWLNITMLSAGTSGTKITMSLPLEINVLHGLNIVVGHGNYVAPSIYYFQCLLALEDEATSTVHLVTSAGVTGVLGQTLVSTPATTALAVASGHQFRGSGAYLIAS